MNLEELSFRNLVTFYRSEILRLADGELALELFADNARARLKKYGVLKQVYLGYLGGNPVRPTDEALKVLEASG